MGFVQQLTALLREEHGPNHEFVLLALLSLVENYPEAQAECRKPEYELRLTLQNILNEFSQDEAFRVSLESILSTLQYF